MDFIFSYWWNAIGGVLFLAAVSFCIINLFRKEVVIIEEPKRSYEARITRAVK